MVLSIQKDSQRFFTFGYYLSNSFYCKFGIKCYNKKNEIRGYMENKDKIQQLFQNDKLLVRAMDDPDLSRPGRIGPKMSRDFSVWAKEVDASLHDGLICASSTLLVANESIPTYKSIGFIINSDQAEIVHVSDMDSCSCGSTKNGDFSACASELSTLAELADKTRKEKLTEMNEVNINIKNDAIIGLFFSRRDRPKAQVLLAQEYYKMHTGKELPILLPALTESSRHLDRTLEKVAGSSDETISNLNETLHEVSDAAKSFQNLTDYLERHPESLIQGKKGE